MTRKKQIALLSLIVLLLAGGCILLWQQPEENEAKQEEVFLIAEELHDSVVSVTVENNKGSYTIKKSGDQYSIDGLQAEEISIGLAENVFYSAVHLKSTAYVEKAEDAATGLKDPSVKLELETDQNETMTLLIGKKSEMLNGCFAQLEGTEDLYLVDIEFPDRIVATADAYLNMAFLDFVYESDYKDLEYLEISGKTIITARFENTVDGFVMVQPMEQMCSQEAIKVTYMHDAVHLSGDEYIGNVEDPEMGFEDPDYMISIKYRDEEICIRVGGKVGERRYVKRDDRESIYLIDETALAFLDNDYREAIGDGLYPRSVADVKEVEITMDGKTYLLEDVQSKGTGYTAVYDGKTIENDVFMPIFNNVRTMELVKNITAPGKKRFV